jgi:1-acyl-sn-glycerol-3-phosphate acyltransferase
MWRNIVGVITLLLYILYSLPLLFFIVYPFGLFKYLLPKQSWQDGIRRLMNKTIQLWLTLSIFLVKHLIRTRVIVEGLKDLCIHDQYIIVANHASAIDTVIIANTLNRKILPPRFFMKSELLWMIPLLGPACFLMEFPFLKRYSKSVLEKKPSLKNRDMAVLKKLCQGFKNVPVSMLTFAEGTRFTLQKAKTQHSPYRHLLKPKAGGLSTVLFLMEKQLHYILDITIAYPGKCWSFWDFLCGRVKKILIKINKIQITDDLIGDYVNDPHFRQHMQEWINQLWHKKDESIEQMTHLS